MKPNTDDKNKDTKAPKILEVGKATDEQLAKWKKEYEVDGPIKVIKLIVSPTEVSYGYLKPAIGDRMVVAKAMSYHKQNMPYETGEFILHNCWLGGDMRQRNDTKLMINAATFASQTIEFMAGSMENA